MKKLFLKNETIQLTFILLLQMKDMNQIVIWKRCLQMIREIVTTIPQMKTYPQVNQESTISVKKNKYHPQ
jgi:hypothetical protein